MQGQPSKSNQAELLLPLRQASDCSPKHKAMQNAPC